MWQDGSPAAQHTDSPLQNSGRSSHAGGMAVVLRERCARGKHSFNPTIHALTDITWPMNREQRVAPRMRT